MFAITIIFAISYSESKTYNYATPINYTDPTGLSWWSAFWNFVAGFFGAVTAVIVTALTGGNFVLGMAAGGAVAGAILGGVSGGWEGALKGAAIGFVIGATMAAGIDKFGYGFAIAAMAASATYAGVTGGLEGLGDFAAGALGSMSGYYAGNAIVSGSTVQSPNANTTTTQPAKQESKADIQIKESLNSGELQRPTDIKSYNIFSPAEARAETATTIAQSAQSGRIGAGNNSNYNNSGSLLDKFDKSLGINTSGKKFDSKVFWAEYALRVVGPDTAKGTSVMLAVTFLAPPPFDAIAGVLLFSYTSGSAIQAYKAAWVPVAPAYDIRPRYEVYRH